MIGSGCYKLLLKSWKVSYPSSSSYTFLSTFRIITYPCPHIHTFFIQKNCSPTSNHIYSSVTRRPEIGRRWPRSRFHFSFGNKKIKRIIIWIQQCAFFGTGTADKRNCQNTTLVHVLHIITYWTLSGAKSRNMSHKKKSPFTVEFIAFHSILSEIGQASTYFGMCRSFFCEDIIQMFRCSVVFRCRYSNRSVHKSQCLH